MKELNRVIKCIKFDPNCGNSDAECFVDPDFYSPEELEYFEVAEAKVILNPSLCDHCVYNDKFKGMNWAQWEAYRKSIGKNQNKRRER